MVTLVNRAKVATATTGAGTITLGSAESGYQSFADAGVVDTDVVRYVIEDGTDWEIGTGTYSAGTLTRTVLESSNADAALNLTGSAVVYVSATAEDIPAVQELYAENPSSPTAPSATGANAVAIGNGPVSAGSASVALGRAYASGTDSFAAAITNNTATYGATGASSIAIGFRAKATANNDSIAMGDRSVATGRWSLALGGQAQASAQNAIAVGYNSDATNVFSFAFGAHSISEGIYSTVIGSYGKSSQRGKHAYSSGYSGWGVGGAQQGLIVLARNTTDATPAVLTSDNSTAGTTNQIILPNNSAYAFHGTIVARQQASAGTACAAWKVEGLIRREGSAGTTVLVNSATTVLDNTPAWGMALSADTTNGCLLYTSPSPRDS